MPPARTRKRKSDDCVDSGPGTPEMAGQKIPTKTGSPVQTPTGQGPAKRRKLGITLAQKQALIDNLQLEVTERARKLRAQYNLQAQGLRTRIEIRVNRIPMALRKAKMGDLLAKYSGGSAHQQASSRSAASHRPPPPVPEKDAPLKRPVSQASTAAPGRASRGPGRPPKRLSNDVAGGNKENLDASSPKKHGVRASPAPDIAHNPSQVLSPTSSNTRIVPRKRIPPSSMAPAAALPQPPRPASPAKSFIARPASPVKKASHGNLISNMVEKARSTRAAATRKTTTSSTASAAPAGGTTRTTRRAAAATGPTAASRAAAAPSRTAHRVSGVSESSDGSTSTVVRKRGVTAASHASTRTAAAAAAPKRTVMGTIKKGVTGATTRKAPASKPAAPAPTTGTGRVLRKRA